MCKIPCGGILVDDAHACGEREFAALHRARRVRQVQENDEIQRMGYIISELLIKSIRFR